MVTDVPLLKRPIIEMFWVAEYKDGTALPQLDPIHKRENKFGEVFHKRVKRFWWIPITPRMTLIFPGTQFNPLLRRHFIELNGSKGFVTRRTYMNIGFGKDPLLRQKVKCYILGIEGGPRREIYPDGTVINIEYPKTRGETQDILHG